MASVELTDIIQALARQLGTATDITGYPWYPPMNSLVFPAAVVGEFHVGPVEDFGGTRTYEFDVTLIVRSSEADRGQQLMWKYMTAPTDSPYSLEGAIDADPSLGGVVQYAWVSTPLDRTVGSAQIDDSAEALGAKFTVSVWA